MTKLRAETEKEKELAARRNAKVDRPNPFSYKTENTFSRLSNYDRSHTAFLFDKRQKKTLADEIIAKQKKQNNPSVH